MSSSQPDSIAQVAPTLEVRWLCRGRLTTSMIEWFSPFVEELEMREDTYLVGGDVKGLSVKIRGGLRLDIKVATGGQGVLDVPGQAQGRLRSWKKWSFPIPPVHRNDVEPPEWVSVGKHRRIGWFTVVDALARARGAGSVGREPTCAVELTEVVKGGVEPWWTLGFEAAGPPDTLRGTIDATAALLFRSSPPGGPELHMAASMSYAEWLQRGPGDD